MVINLFTSNSILHKAIYLLTIFLYPLNIMHPCFYFRLSLLVIYIVKYECIVLYDFFIVLFFFVYSWPILLFYTSALCLQLAPCPTTIWDAYGLVSALGIQGALSLLSLLALSLLILCCGCCGCCGMMLCPWIITSVCQAVCLPVKCCCSAVCYCLKRTGKTRW